MLEAAGVKNINTYDTGHAMGHGIHEMGTASMGKDPKTSVLNSNNQVWDAKNVFVTDGAMHDIFILCKPITYVYGINSKGSRFCSKRIKKRKSLKNILSATFKINTMDRRELLKMIAVVTGGAVIGGEMFLSGCKTGAKADAGFTATNISLLDEVAETIIPATTTPGAKAAQVGEFMKVMVNDCYTQAQQDAFMKGIGTLDEACKKINSKSFMDCTAQQRHEFLTSLEKEAKEFNKAVMKKTNLKETKMKKAR